MVPEERTARILSRTSIAIDSVSRCRFGSVAGEYPLDASTILSDDSPVPKVDRNNPRRSRASESTYSMMEFVRQFPDDATCLEWLWRKRCSEDGSHALCPKCKQTRKFHKVTTRPAWACDSCGYHMRPTAGTIFHGSATSLHLWFYAMYLMTSTRCAVSAKHLERELGVTYKTAWRMANLIRNKLMVEDGDEPLSGDVEADEMFVGGKPKAADRARARRLAPNPGQVGAFAQRQDGRVRRRAARR
jgi:transposase